LTGRLPYEANSLSELALMQQRELPPPLDRLNPAVPPELALAVDMALSIDPQERPGTAIALAEALRDGAAGVSPTAAGATTIRRPRDGARATPPAGGWNRDGSTEATRVSRRGMGADPAPTASQPRVAPPPRGSGYGERYATPSPPPPGVRSGDAYAGGRAVRRPPAYPPRRGRRRVARMLGLLVLLVVVVAAVVAALLIANGTSSTAVHVQSTFSNDWHQAVRQLQHLISGNSK
jgi:serine/threonine-protein kinase